VFFAYDSAALLPQASPKLITLGQALSDPELRGSSFLIAGHTDARGSDGYNLELSNARAEAVKRFLAPKLPPGAREPDHAQFWRGAAEESL